MRATSRSSDRPLLVNPRPLRLGRFFVGNLYGLASAERDHFRKPLKRQHLNFWHANCLHTSKTAPNLRRRGSMGKISSRVRTGAFAGALGAALMATTSAFAIPTTVIAGIEVPTAMVPGGNYIATQLDYEKLVQAKGNTFYGIGQTTAIADSNAVGTYAG